jgi:GT2 family glycosyltransferase
MKAPGAVQIVADDQPLLADLSVVIPCRNAGRDLARQLEALAREQWSGRWEVIVADNGSTDDTRAVAERFADRLRVRVVDAADRPGRQHACNAGARVAGASVIFVDADDEIAPGYVAALGEALRDHPLVAARIDHTSLNDGWVRDGGSGAQATGLQGGFGFLPFGSGGTLGVRTALFEQLGGFAETMDFAEDVDFCWRAQLAGADIEFVPAAALRYRYRQSLREMYRQHRNFGRGSALLYREYRDRGMPRRQARQWVREWFTVVAGPLRLRSRAQAARWVRRAGRCVGRLQGSLRYRVWYP